MKDCDVCNSEVIVDQYGNGKCKICGWEQNKDCLDFPKVSNPPNFISLNQAKAYYAENRPFLPTYEELVELVNRGFDISFVYKGKRYQLDRHETFTLWETGTENYWEYKDLEEFSKRLSIGDELVKGFWKNIKKVRYEN